MRQTGELMEARKPAPPPSGRLLVILGRPGSDEPRLSIGQTGKNTSPTLGRDVDKLMPGAIAVLDDQSVIFPIGSLGQLQPRTYAIQALLHTNRDLNLANAPGDMYSPVTTARLDPKAGATLKLELTRSVPEEALPVDQELVKYLKVPSPLLSGFHGRTMALRAGVILPRDFNRHPEQQYPVRVHIGGYGVTLYRCGGHDDCRIWLLPRMDGR